MKINIKPLSVNQCWRGRRFKTSQYIKYEQMMLLLLKPMKVQQGALKLVITVGFSSKLADIDNFLKPFIDILQKKYNFNDRDIFELNVKKEIVAKGKEFIKFEIKSIKQYFIQ